MAGGADEAGLMTECPRLVLFVRYPTAGACKTRLIPAVGAAGAAALHRRLTDRTIAILKQSGCPVTIAYTGASRSAFEDWLGHDVDLAEQAAGDLSDRLLAFIDQAPVIFFGADTPDLATRHVDAAIAGLDCHDVVIGPAEDGGYYLIGIRRPLGELFIDMPWSTDKVFPETRARLDRLGIEPRLLETLSDCDRPEDLTRWPQLTA